MFATKMTNLLNKYGKNCLILVVFAFLALFPAITEAAIAFDATSINGSVETSTSSFSWSHTVTGSNTILFVGTFGPANADGDLENGVTYANVAMTKAGTGVPTSGRYSYLWYLVNPASGANTVVVNWDSSVSAMSGTAASYTGVLQTSPVEATSSATTNTNKTATGTVTTISDNSWVVFSARNENDQTATAGASAFMRTQQVDGAVYFADTNGPITPAGSTNMSMSVASAVNWMATTASFAPAAEEAVAVVSAQQIIWWDD